MIELKTSALLTTKLVAERLGITSCRVIQLSNAGRLRPIVAANGLRLFLFEDVERFAMSRIRAVQR